MKAKKLIAKMQALLSADDRELARQAEEIEKLLIALEAKETRFRSKLNAAETDAEREKLQRKIDVCSAQRRKGEQAINAIRDQ